MQFYLRHIHRGTHNLAKIRRVSHIHYNYFNFKHNEGCCLNNWGTKEGTTTRKTQSQRLFKPVNHGISTRTRSFSTSSDNVSVQSENADILNTTAELLAVPTPELAWYYPSHWVISLVQSIHEITGCSYSIIMASLTIAIRLLFFPMALNLRKKTYMIDNSVDVHDQEYEKTTLLSSVRSAMKQRRKRRNMSTTQDRFLPFINMAATVTVLMGLNSMTYYYPAELSTGGMLWFTDLTKPDPIFFLPILSWCTFIILGETGGDMFGTMNAERKSLATRNIFRGLYAIMILPMMTFPSAIFCYWIPNNLISLSHIVMFNDPTCMKYLGIIKQEQQIKPRKVYIKNKGDREISSIKLLQEQEQELQMKKKTKKRKNRKKKR